MKAKIVTRMTFGNIFDYVNNRGHEIKQMVIERQNEVGDWELLVISKGEDHVFVFPISSDKYDAITSPLDEIVDIPDKLVEEIVAASEQQKRLVRQVERLLW
jgi:hypothetical protein